MSWLVQGTGTASIRVKDINDMPPQFTKSEWYTEVDETDGIALPDAPILTVTVHDEDETNKFHYKVYIKAASLFNWFPLQLTYCTSFDWPDRWLKAADSVPTSSPWYAITTEPAHSKSFNLSTMKTNFKGTDFVSWFKLTIRYTFDQTLFILLLLSVSHQQCLWLISCHLVIG